eukprot:TRINITY_DN19728_c0_g1_i1.p1 TRINITY_DN19728_c0_g1~~TRINITY_DN19728_c0_g1_i1.p1  ORF type:complete len:768 (+),score=146.94 TRINITY_DN19728_c0_g1_i1:392-2695(+)
MDDEQLLSSIEKLAPLYAKADPDAVLPLDDTLSHLLQRSAEEEGRLALGRCMAVERLASLMPDLSQHCPDLRLASGTNDPLADRSFSSVDAAALQPLLLLLRIFRNLLVGKSANQDQFRLCGAHDVISVVADRLILGAVQRLTSPTSSIAGTPGSTSASPAPTGIEQTTGGTSEAGTSAGFNRPSGSPAVKAVGTSAPAVVPSPQSGGSSSPLQKTESSNATSASPPAVPAQGSPISPIPLFPSSSSGSTKSGKSSLFYRRSLSNSKKAPAALSTSSPSSSALSSPSMLPTSPFPTLSSASSIDPSSVPSAPLTPGMVQLPEVLAVPADVEEVMRAVLQVLGNFATSDPSNVTGVWDRCFPGALRRFAAVHSSAVHGPLVRLLHACCFRPGSKQAEELCLGSQGASLLHVLLRAAAELVPHCSSDKVLTDAEAEHWEWLEILLSSVCYPYVPQLFPLIGHRRARPVMTPGKPLLTPGREGTPAAAGSSQLPFSPGGFCLEQATLLAILTANVVCESGKLDIPGIPGGPPPSDTATSSTGTAKDKGANSGITSPSPETSSFLLVTAQDAARSLAASWQQVSGLGGSLPTGTPAIDILGYTLALLRAALLSGPSESSSVATATFAVDLLQGLPPPIAPPSSTPSATTTASKYPPSEPYKGYRKDVVALLACGCFRSPAAQNAVREKGGIPTVLQQCVAVDGAPFLREWGLFAVRNLLEGNEANQEAVREMELQGAADVPQLRSLGYKVEMSGEGGRPKLVNVGAEEEKQ